MDVHKTLVAIPADWDHFTILDSEQGLFQIKICPTLQTLFSFETDFGQFTYLIISGLEVI